MSEILTLKPYENISYKIIIDDSFSALIDSIKELNIENKKICIVTETNVSKIYLDTVRELLKHECKEISKL